MSSVTKTHAYEEPSTESGSSEDDVTRCGREDLVADMVARGIIESKQAAEVDEMFMARDVTTRADRRDIHLVHDERHNDNIIRVPRGDVRTCRACDDVGHRENAHRNLLICEGECCGSQICGKCVGKLCRKCRSGDKDHKKKRKPRDWRRKLLAQEQEKKKGKRPRSRSRSPASTDI